MKEGIRYFILLLTGGLGGAFMCLLDFPYDWLGWTAASLLFHFVYPWNKECGK